MQTNSDINHSSCVSEAISRLFLDERQSDVVFVVEAKRIAAHKLVLAARSSAFKDMFFEKTSLTECKREIHVNDCSALSFKNFIKYIYTGKISLDSMSETERQEMLALALKYQMNPLVDSILEPAAQTPNTSSASSASPNTNTNTNTKSSLKHSSKNSSRKQDQTMKLMDSKNPDLDGPSGQNAVSNPPSLQFEDLANVENGAIVVSGLNPDKLFSGRRDFDEKSLTKHKIETNSKGIIIKLNIPVVINVIRFRLLDTDPKGYYCYYVQVSDGSLNWQLVADNQYYSCRSLQTIVFGQRLVQYIQILGTFSNEKSFFSNTRYFTIATFLCGLTRTPPKTVNGYWEPDCNLASMARGAIVTINGTDFCRNAKMINDSLDFEYKRLHQIFSEFHFDADSQLMVLLSQPIVTSSISFYIYGDHKFRYRIKISIDPIDKEPKKWTVVVDRSDKFGGHRAQVINFQKSLVSIICIDRIRCLNEAVTTLPIVSLSCPSL